jgi:hypothetical protein
VRLRYDVGHIEHGVWEVTIELMTWIVMEGEGDHPQGSWRSR